MSITFVCCPKPFNKDFNDIQYNAIKSWTLLKTVERIVICGNDDGVKEFVDSIKIESPIDIQYVEHVKRTSNGTPLVNDIFKIGENYANKHICYINCDIILMSDFDKTFAAFISSFPTQKNFLLVGKRWDWHNPTRIDFAFSEKAGQKGNSVRIDFAGDWEKTVKEIVVKDGHLHSESAIDYFIHSKTTFPMIHPFAIGKFFWDNWLVGNAFRRPDVLTVDLSETLFVIHQNSPWFVYSKSVSEKSKAADCEEAIMNKSFDTFGRNIANGTKYMSSWKNGKVVFKKKNYLTLKNL